MRLKGSGIQIREIINYSFGKRKGIYTKMDINKTKGDDRQVMRDDASNGFLVIMVHSSKQKQYRRN